MDDNALMARLALGDTEALAELIRRHRAWAEGLADGLLHDHALAEDMVQEAFTRVYLLRQSYQPTFAFRTWLAVLVRRLCIDQLRRGGHAPVLMDDLPEGAAESAESLVLQNEKRLRLWAMIAALSDTDRALLEGYALDGLSYRELAKRYRLTTGQVKIRLHRIRRKLHDKERDEE